MRLIDSIRKDWCDRAQFQRRYASLSLDGPGLMLGTAVLAKRMAGTVNIDRDEGRARILALLTAAYGPSMPATVLGNVERAIRAERDGKRPLAAIHLAHAGLPPVGDNDDACQRLFVFEKLIEEGVEPHIILRALRPADEFIERANPYHDPRGLFTTANNAIEPVTAKQPKLPSTAWKQMPNANFRQRIAERESTAQRPDNGYGAQSSSGAALGRYQMQEKALIDGGWKNGDGTWSEKANEAGVSSDKDFLANPNAQEQAFTDAMQAFHGELDRDGALSQVGQTIKDSAGNPLAVTEAGIMAAAHKEGTTAVGQYFNAAGRTRLTSQQITNIEGRLRYAAEVPYDSASNALQANTGTKGPNARKK